MEVPIDTPAALAEWLVAQGVEAVPEPVPDDLMGRLPLVVLRDSGGSRTWPVLDSHRVGVDAYGADATEAMDVARQAYALLDSMNVDYPPIGGVQTYGVGFGGLPQPQTDPQHQDAPMATFLCEVGCRAAHVD